eukprot:COSAG01_NODE_21692_length_889_cov_66.967089_1_plen_63_part_00
MQQLLVELRPVPSQGGADTSSTGRHSRLGLVLTAWPCEARWRDAGSLWSMSEHPSYSVALLA